MRNERGTALAAVRKEAGVDSLDLERAQTALYRHGVETTSPAAHPRPGEMRCSYHRPLFLRPDPRDRSTRAPGSICSPVYGPLDIDQPTMTIVDPSDAAARKRRHRCAGSMSASRT